MEVYMLRITEVARTFHPRRKLAAACAVAIALAGCAHGDLPGPRTGSGIPLPEVFNPALPPLPEGATASYPSFDGDAFRARLRVRPQQSLEPEQALQEIAPVLRAVGFDRSLEDLGIPDEPLRLPPPDLAALAEQVCAEEALQRRGTYEVCRAMLAGEPLPAAEEAVRKAYGIGFAELRAGVETAVLQYPFRQLVDGVPIEGAGAIASRREGESLSTVHGTLFNRFAVLNRPARDSKAVLASGRRALGRWPGRWFGKGLPRVVGELRLVLLPKGEGRLDGQRVPGLRYALRAVLAVPAGQSWMVWIDAETGDVLDLAPQFDNAIVSTTGERWQRDPGASAGTHVPGFEVSPNADDELVLALDGVFQRVDRKGDGKYNDGEVEVSGATFDVLAINDESKALCKSGHNVAYGQVHAYSHLYSFWKMVTGAGIFPQFPEKPVRIWMDHANPSARAFYDYDYTIPIADSLLRFPMADGFQDSDCPDAPGERMNGVQDATTLAHEMAHLSVKRLQERRCGGQLCDAPLPHGRLLFHDFADAFASAYASTNCISGWADKNLGGVDKALYCAGATSETSELPRLLDPASDRFPGHRDPNTPDTAQPYADGQIAGAALWKVRQGMRSKDLVFGTLEHWQRLHRALWDFGLIEATCASCTGEPGNLACTACDRDIYRYLQDLETQMVLQWASGIGHTAGKVVSGWADAGIFLVPYGCLDGNPGTVNPACLSGEGGGDAVIEVDDREKADDLVIDGATHPEVDYLKRGGLPPRFRVWTGPRYGFDSNGKALEGLSQCNSDYSIEVSNDPDLAGAQVVDGTTASCYAEVLLPDPIWQALQGAAGDVNIYYRVVTSDANGGNERRSTSPGAGAFSVPVPFVVVNGSGTP
jgi:hypothetical protein